MMLMDKPHWRCDRCDSSRFKVVTKGQIQCYSCKFQPTEYRESENNV